LTLVRVTRTVKVTAVAAVLGAGLALWQLQGEPEAQAHEVEAATAQAEFETTYRYAGGDKGRAAVEAAIEAATAEMNPLIRGIARKRLIEANKIIASLSFSLGGDPLVATYVDGRVIEAPRSGDPIRWVDQFGEKIKVSHHLDGDGLIQKMSGSKGKRRNVYRFSDEDKSMTLSVTIESGVLPEPVRYKVRYERK
jgi:hypothetical protein